MTATTFKSLLIDQLIGLVGIINLGAKSTTGIPARRRIAQPMCSTRCIGETVLRYRTSSYWHVGTLGGRIYLAAFDGDRQGHQRRRDPVRSCRALSGPVHTLEPGRCVYSSIPEIVRLFAGAGIWFCRRKPQILVFHFCNQLPAGLKRTDQVISRHGGCGYPLGILGDAL